jgi:hypothetical protein
LALKLVQDPLFLGQLGLIKQLGKSDRLQKVDSVHLVHETLLTIIDDLPLNNFLLSVLEAAVTARR